MADGYYTEQVHGPHDYFELDNFDLASLLRDRGLPAARVQQILGGNAVNLLNGILTAPGVRE